ncbi:MAG TPA: hypothetical protein VIA07_08980 [Desulfuromonadales bacterium]
MIKEKPADHLDLSLARRLHNALIASLEELFQIMQDPSPEVLRTALKNPRLCEDHLLALLKRRDLPEDLLNAVSQFERSELSHRLRLALAKNPGTPGPVFLVILPHLYLFELLDLCLLPGITPDQRYAAERQVLQRLANTPLGNKLILARRGTATLVGELLKEGEPRLMEACLENPRLKEVSLLQFLGGPKADAETISMVARHPRWKNRPNLRLAILKNRRTPSIWFTLFLPRLVTSDLHGLAASRRLDPSQKKLVEDELKLRRHA